MYNLKLRFKAFRKKLRNCLVFIRKFLKVADRFTGWFEVYKIDGKVMTLINTLRNLFSQMGVPVELATDGGPC